MASYRKRPNGWEYRINYYDSTGKRKTKSQRVAFRTKSEAIKAATEMELKLQDNINVDEDITLYDYFKQWCEVYKKPTVSKITYKAYINSQRKIELFFGDKKLKSITATEYQRVLNSYAKTHAQDTCRALLMCMSRRALKWQCMKDISSVTFASLLKSTQRTKVVILKQKFLEVEEYERLIHETNKHPGVCVLYSTLYHRQNWYPFC